MKIALFSDVHANLPALETVLGHIGANAYDAVYCLGDMGGYGGNPNEVQEAVAELGYPVLLGNYDEAVGFEKENCGCSYTKPFDIEMSRISFQWTLAHTSERNKSLLRAYPQTMRLNVEGLSILLCHGSPVSNTEYLFEARSDGYLSRFTSGEKYDAHADVIAFGHTHVPFHRCVAGVHFVNTGSVGRPKDGNALAGYTLLTIKAGKVETEHIRLEYNVEAACKNLIEAGLPEYFANYLRTGGGA